MLEPVDLAELVALIKTLREQCPWDKKQTPLSMSHAQLDEAYELLEAAASGSWEAIQEELGDLLFQVVMITRMAEEAQAFDLLSVIQGVHEKLVRRHPHVFQETPAADEQEAQARWDAIKGQEKKRVCPGDLPDTLSAFSDAHLVQRHAAKKKFDWPGPEGVLDKLREEVEELSEAMGSEDRSSIQREIGDILFTVVNLCRHLDISPEQSLRDCTERFKKRFNPIEKALASGELSLDEMERIWQAQKEEA